MTVEWTGAAIEPGEREGPPSPERWEDLAVPGRPPSLAGADAAAYRGVFPDPRETTAERGLLEVRGAYARAVVWVNGERLAEGHHVAPIRVPFDPEPSNEVVVACYAPDDRFGGLEATPAVPATASVPSIRGGVDVEAVPAAYVHDLAVRGRPGGGSEGGSAADPTRESAGGSSDADATTGAGSATGATIEVTATVDAARDLDDRLTLSVRPQGFRGGGAMERVPVRASAGERVTVQTSIEVRNPKRWWPRELGRQHRYAVRATLGDHERTSETGLVSVERDGGDLLVNGRRHRPRGLLVQPGTDPEAAVERAVEANATMLRARAHVPPAALPAACDEAGLLFWQDVPLTGPGAFDAERGQELAATLSASLGNHPSVACYGVHDDPVRPFDGLGSGALDRLRFRWRAWRASYDPADAEVLTAALPSDRVAFTVCGPPGIDPDAAQLYPGWSYLDATDVEWLLDRSPSLGEVVGATGAGSVARPTDGPVPGARPGAGAVDGREGGLEPGPSQREQVRIVRTVLDALRRRGAGTLVVDSLADVADDGGTGLLAADGTPKPAFDAVAATFEPVQAVLDGPPTGGAVGVTVCNDTDEARTGELAWTAGRHSGTSDVAVDAFDRADAGAVDVPDDAEELALELRLEDATVSNGYELSRW